MARINSKAVLRILGAEELQIFIPINQRNYDWTIENVKKLINDLLDFYSFKQDLKKDVQYEKERQNYFLGTMLYKKIGSNDSDITRISLVDGQQRITTILLIIKVLSELKILEISKYIYINSEYKNEKTLKISRSKSEKTLINILEGNSDNDKIMDNNYIVNYHFIKEIIKDKEIGTKIFESLTNTIVAWVLIQSFEDENKMFETINSTGKPLEAKDLIKNYIFSQTHGFTFNEREDLENIFNNKIEDIFAHKSFNPNKFYRYMIADLDKSNKLVNEDKNIIYEAFKEMVNKDNLKSYENTKITILDIQKRALIFANIVLGKNEEIKNVADSKFVFYKKILEQQMTLFPMYSQLVYENTKLENDQLIWKDEITESEILVLISKYYFYRSITGRKMKNITRDVPKYFKQYKNRTDEISILGFEKYLNNLQANDQILPKPLDVISDIYNITYLSDRKLVCNILLASEIASKNKEPFKRFSKKWQIEHILPQNSEKWRKSFYKLNKEEEFENFEEQKHNIANLTLLVKKLNQDISNDVFIIKKEKIKADCFLNLNKVIYKYDEYNRELLKDRMYFIIQNFINFFNIEVSNEINKVIKKHQEEGVQFSKVITDPICGTNFNFLPNIAIKEYIKKCEEEIKRDITFKKYGTTFRTILEQSLRYIADYKDASLFDLINNVKDRFDKKTLNDIHEIRKIGNTESHELSDEKSKINVLYLLEKLHGILQITYNNEKNSQFNGSIYWELNKLYSPDYEYKNSINKINLEYPKEINGYNALTYLNIEDHRVLETDELFEFVPYGEPQKMYNVKNRSIFNLTLIPKCLFLYLVKGMSSTEIDKTLSKRVKGKITGATLAYFRIVSTGKARGTLRHMLEKDAWKLINRFIKKYF